MPKTPSAPPLPPEDSYLLRLTRTLSNNLYDSQTQTLTREEVKDAVQKQLDDKIYELPDDSPRLELGDGCANLSEADDVLDEKLLNKKEIEAVTLEKIKEEYDFDEIKDAFDEAAVRHQPDVFYGGTNENFVQACNFFYHQATIIGNLLLFFYLNTGKI